MAESHRVRIPRVNIMLRRNGSDKNLVNVECAAFDASAYVDYMRSLLSGEYDYMIIEPVHPVSLNLPFE